jgi:hypothetical protein
MQQKVWRLLTKGFTMADIAKQLNTSPQYVHQTRRNAESKLTRAIMETAEANNIQITKIRPREGLLYGYHPALDQHAFVSYSTKGGIKIWYWHDQPETITDEAFLGHIRTYLLDLAEERSLILTDEDKQLHPAKLANKIFRHLMPEVTIS